MCFAEVLQKHNKSFVVFDDDSQRSSTVAGGLYNPVILKRFTAAWNAQAQLQIALPFYEQIEKRLMTKVDHKVPVLRRFASAEEQNGWFEASDKPKLTPFLSTKILQNENSHVHADFGFGEVLHTGRIDTKVLLSSYAETLKEKEMLVEASFDYDKLKIKEEGITYQNIVAKHIVFAEGFGIHNNPWFKHLPLKGTKGELLTIKAPDLKLQNVLKSSVFLIPIGDDMYKVGATYNWKDKTNNPTEEAKEELLTKLKTFLKCDFEVIDHVAGIRPTVGDRRPLVGRHPDHSNLAVLNGLGTRGVMIGPTMASALYVHLENNEALDPEVDIIRFKKH